MVLFSLAEHILPVNKNPKTNDKNTATTNNQTILLDTVLSPFSGKICNSFKVSRFDLYGSMISCIYYLKPCETRVLWFEINYVWQAGLKTLCFAG